MFEWFLNIAVPAVGQKQTQLNLRIAYVFLSASTAKLASFDNLAIMGKYIMIIFLVEIYIPDCIRVDQNYIC